MSNPADQAEAPVLILVRDLMFLPRITRSAVEAGVPTRVLRDPKDLAGQAGTHVIVDLSLGGALEAAAAWRAAGGGSVTAFIGHTEAATIERARAAGIDRVMAKGAFVAQLVQILSGMRAGQ